jgi:signal transduction histidine kinase
VARWCLGGGALFLATIALSMGIRLFEGRIVSEPAFTLLLAAEAGALAGFVAGYYRTRALADKRRAERSVEGLAIVNSVIRHDLRNDLQIIEGYAELMAAEGENGAPGRAGTVRERAAQARERLDDTEAIAKTISGTASIGVVDLAAVAADVVAHGEDTYGVSIDTDLPESAPVAANDGIRSVVDNLVENAVEHSHRDGPEVAVSVEEGGGATRLVVRDGGPGFPTEGTAILEGRRIEGAGGGLRIVRRLVEEYGGEITVTDNEPQGTVVMVELPAETG